MASIRVVVKGKNLEVSEALRAYAEKKIGKLEKFITGDQEVLAELMLRTERGLHIAELTIDLRQVLLRGEGKTQDMYASIDDTVERIERQFAKFKTRIMRKFQGPKISELAANDTTTQEKENSQPQVVRTKRFAFKPMAVEEAVMQMELLGHDFFVFSNAATEEVNVVYKRKDGNYGLIEPEF